MTLAEELREHARLYAVVGENEWAVRLTRLAQAADEVPPPASTCARLRELLGGLARLTQRGATQ